MTKTRTRPSSKRCLVPNDAEFRKMWDDQMPTRDIAKFYGVGRHVINNTAKRYGYPQRGPKRPVGPKVEPVAVEAPKTPLDATVLDVSAPLTDRLVATKGRWDGLGLIREEQQWSNVFVQQQYHRAMTGRPPVTSRV